MKYDPVGAGLKPAPTGKQNTVSQKDLPEGWEWKTLGEIRQDHSMGIVPNKMPDQLFELYSVPSFEKQVPEILSGNEIGSNKQIVEEGTVLLCKINPRINRAWVVGSHSKHLKIASTEWIPFFSVDDVDPKYLCYYLRQNEIRDFLANNVSGVGGSLMRVRPAVIKDYPFPVAPLPTQHFIVAEIEKQFSRLDEAVAGLKRIKANLKRYKASVLKAAVEGKLTEEWRKAHPNVETGAALLKRILTERKKKWEEKNPGKKYKEPVAPDTSNLPELPEGWVWSCLGQLAWSVKDGPHYSPNYSETGIPFISGGNIRPEGIDFSTAKYITPALHTELSQRCKPAYGDLLYTKGGTTGIAKINTEKREFNVWVHVAVLKLVDSVERFYIQHALNSAHCYRQSQKYTHGVGNQDLGLTRMVWITVPLPPLEEQKAIISEIERRLSIILEMEHEVEVNLKRAERLRQSILKKAFSGGFVS